MRVAAPKHGSDSPIRPELTINLDAVAANTRLFAARTAGDLMAVVKADGFGHGADAVARTALANGATWLGVTGLVEALSLRKSGLSAPLLSWLNPVDADFGAAHRAGVDIAVPSLEHLAGVIWSMVATGDAGPRLPARVHLHVDCGMARDGAPAEVWPALCREARRAERRGLIHVVGVMGHLGCADVPDDDCNASGRQQFDRARRIAESFGLRPSHRHLAATAATLTDPRSHHTLSRVGVGLVGIDPSGSTDLRPALTLRAPIVSVRAVPAGTAVGYGHSWRSPRHTRLGLVPLGYADGLPRSASNRAEVQVLGQRCPVVGRISMDQTVIDLGDVAATPGDAVIVFGPGGCGEPTVRDWAQWADTIEHEIVTGIGARVVRTLHSSVLKSVP